MCICDYSEPWQLICINHIICSVIPGNKKAFHEQSDVNAIYFKQEPLLVNTSYNPNRYSLSVFMKCKSVLIFYFFVVSNLFISCKCGGGVKHES